MYVYRLKKVKNKAKKEATEIEMTKITDMSGAVGVVKEGINWKGDGIEWEAREGVKRSKHSLGVESTTIECINFSGDLTLVLFWLL